MPRANVARKQVGEAKPNGRPPKAIPVSQDVLIELSLATGALIDAAVRTERARRALVTLANASLGRRAA